MLHDLKILPCYFDAVVSGDKRFEIRDNSDRGFQKGDTIRLQEWSIVSGYSGRVLQSTITYVTGYGQKDGYVVFGFTIDGEVVHDHLLNRKEA